MTRNIKSRNTTKTDLSLLLECLKFQMKYPDLQKRSLQTIHSICENKEENVDLLREMGGVAFVYNLSKSNTVHPDVKETALFTLSTLAEANVYCKNSLCRKETFADLADWLTKEDITLRQKRVSVYLLFVLVSSNKSGQTLAQTSGCLDILLKLFRATYPLSPEATVQTENATQLYQLWASVSSALCGCVNNPQNEEGQRICVAAFPIIKNWLQEIELPRTEIIQPMCSFISMAVANNACVQESFFASGGLETLTLALARLASAADTSLLSCKLSVSIVKTLSACIADNPALASILAQHGMVSHLFSLLASPHFDPEDILSVLVSVGHCTGASEEHQSQLVQCGGLPIVITLLTEETSEEVRKAATFILHTCKQATKLEENADALRNNDNLKNSTREILHKIDLQKRQEVEDEQKDTNPLNTNEQQDQALLPTALTIPSHRKAVIKAICTRGQASDLSFEEMTSCTFDSLQSSCHHSCDIHKVLQEATEQFRKRYRNLELRKRHHGDSVKHTDPNSKRNSEGETQSSNNRTGNGEGNVRSSRPEHNWRKQYDCDSMPSPRLDSAGRSRLVAGGADVDELWAVEMIEGFASDAYSSPTPEETLRSFDSATAIMGAFPSLWCYPDLTELLHCASLIPVSQEAACHSTSSLGDVHCRKETILRVPLGAWWSRLEEKLQETSSLSVPHPSSRRKRQDFSNEEVWDLLAGVQRFGFSWNTILWSYPFQPGRTNVDLAKKYKRLMVTEKMFT
ncbi:telomere repeats-binding bouquet formation protein 1 [Pholidichthys leucotaenia]